MQNNFTCKEQFNTHIATKFQLYNSLFFSLPFNKIEKTGILLSMLMNHCAEGYEAKMSPTEIIESFLKKHTTYTNKEKQLDFLFKIIQYVERQVVLFDSLEDASFNLVREVDGIGSLKQLEIEIYNQKKEKELIEKLNDFSVRIVLTAHPTQFYPDAVLGIINELSIALKNNDTQAVNMLLQQLGKTPFLKKIKPTPYDEAKSLLWYLENVFYDTIGKINSYINERVANYITNQSIVNLGFWPGGDRDGNPFVTAAITKNVADALRQSIIKCYHKDIVKLKKRLTFKGVEDVLNRLEIRLYENNNTTFKNNILSANEIIEELKKIEQIIISQHNGLFVNLVAELITKVKAFGLHFASLDIRQESTIHQLVLDAIFENGYSVLNHEEKIKFLTNISTNKINNQFKDDVINDTLQNIKTIKKIQKNNGETGCNRYIISQCHSTINVLEVYGLFLSCGWQKNSLTVDIVPLFETIDDLENAAYIMQDLYTNLSYKSHLKQRNNKQIIMLGFSDGTKDGGYLMANYAIYKAKEILTAVSQQNNIEVVFFDGRGGPPARGGGKTHQFYASMGKNISSKEIQLTVQGQTISSNFGTIDSASFNIERLVSAGLSNNVLNNKNYTLEKEKEMLFKEMAANSLVTFTKLKNHPQFVSYLYNISPIKYYSDTNIASRPTKRNSTSAMSLNDLRAIPFVGAWSQLKQNVTGYYGVGTALQNLDKKGKFDLAKNLYKNSLFFKTLMDNCEMAMKKCFFPLTAYLKQNTTYGEIWNMIYDEFELTKKYILLLSDSPELMHNYPVDISSIEMREKIVLPLLTIQQYAINMLMNEPKIINKKYKEAYKKLIIRSSFGIINAGRNSA
jgi:phosphoenolpyruvate carboxylase